MTDKYQRNLGWCEEAQTYCDVSEKAYKQGRKDAIDELVAEVQKTVLLDWQKALIVTIAEQMKGRTE